MLRLRLARFMCQTVIGYGRTTNQTDTSTPDETPTYTEKNKQTTA
jgi:hypothetical protein